jgi:hypothetical protein
MNKKGKNSKKVGTNSGDINNSISEAAIVTEEQQYQQDQLGADIETKERTQESLEGTTDRSDVAQDDENGQEDSVSDEEWELKKIMSIEAINHPFPVKCSHDNCTLVAATVWVSNHKPDEKWYSCLDCQVSINVHSPMLYSNAN